ncbi:MAG: GNAT family N-acetyltransferase [Candidatus Latescibacteria bacterium]|nr:GNAT family N-acetyltransferase [Candidatus Latescibacterota bacterium]
MAGEESVRGWKVELVREGRSISRLWIVDVQMRIGVGVVKVGGIAGVGTDRQYRNQGLASRVLEASLALMLREGYEVSMLFGIPDFYHRFGFATCIPEHNLRLDTRDAERAAKQLRLRLYRKADRAAIIRLYNRQNEGRTGAVVRDPKTWKGIEKGSGFGVDAGVQVAVNAADQVQGYVVYDAVPGRCRAAEVGGRAHRSSTPCCGCWPGGRWNCGARKSLSACPRITPLPTIAGHWVARWTPSTRAMPGPWAGSSTCSAAWKRYSGT